MCINVGNGSRCHNLCLTCSEDSYCGIENACTSCYPEEYKISPNFDDLIFKCSKICDGDALEQNNYYYCHHHGSAFKEEIADFTKNPFIQPNSSHFLLIIFSVIVGLFFLVFLLKIIFDVKNKYLDERSGDPESNIEMQPLNPVKLVTPQPIQQTFKKLEMITNLNDFEKGEELSSGAFSFVYKGTLRGIAVAIKVAKDDGRRSIHRELKFYDIISHPNILEAKGVHFGVDNMLFLPLRTFDLKNYFLDYKGVIEFQQLKRYSIQIADGMKYLHGKNILHCDLKIDNILVKDENAEFVEISDFGCAVDLDRDYEIRFLCTESHISYEILKNRQNHTASKASDVWAFAVTMWQIFQKTHLLPSDFFKKEDIIKNYETGKKLPMPTTVSEDFWRYIILPCFDLHPKARPNIEDLYKALIKFQEENP